MRSTGATQRLSGFGAGGLAAVNKGGLIQARLRFDSTPSATAYLFVGSGASATLHVTWQ